MQYQVPQFIEIEDKIFGPLTLKQFLYLAGGAGICLIMFTFLPLFLVVILGIPVMAAAAALAFYEVNGRPMIVAVEHAFGYFFGGKLYLWKQRQAEAPKAAAKQAAPAQIQMPVPKLSESKLKDLAWSLNIRDREQAEESNNKARTGFEI
jgi:hypothetical protein